jgi:hypothetical protein
MRKDEPACFSGDAMVSKGGPISSSGDGYILITGIVIQVHTSTRGTVPMRSVRVGDHVLYAYTQSGDAMYSRVYMFLHRQIDEEHTFLRVRVHDGHTIELTDKHIVYVQRACTTNTSVTAVFARSVRVGDCLLSSAHNTLHASAVVHIDSVTKTGIYAPHTHAGRLIVDGVLASCHAELLPEVAAAAVARVVYYWRTALEYVWGGRLDDEHQPLNPLLYTLHQTMHLLVPSSFV